MKFLISFDTNVIRQEQASEWGIDSVLVWETDLKPDLDMLPFTDKEELVVFIPTVFDYRNSLSYDGANLGLRILMHYIRKGKADVDIVLIGNESETDFLLQYDYPNILKIPGFHYIRFNKKIVAQYQLPQREQLKVNEYKPYLDNLGLKIPSSFKSTHSLTNEWCLYKWNSFMEFNENTSSLVGYLYFDYLITIEKLNRTKYKTPSEHLKEKIRKLPTSRILVIEDKYGWHKFFKDFFEQAPTVEVHCLGDDFNKLELHEIKTKIHDEVNDFNPHVIILDFRLMEDKDAEIRGNMKDMKEISGYRVLSRVLKGTVKYPLNSFGRQVLIFTATSRIENIFLLKEGNADGFILKEKPEQYAAKEITKDLISRMVDDISLAVKRAKFLIPLNEKLSNLWSFILRPELRINDDLKDTIKIVAESVRLITQNNKLNEDVLKLVYLNLFSILECSKDNTNDIRSYISEQASIIDLGSDPDTYALWDTLCPLRNALAHDGKIKTGKLKGSVISVSLLMEWIPNLVHFIEKYIVLYLNHNK